MLKPSYLVTLDQDTLSQDTLGPLVALEVLRCKNGAADEAIFTLGLTPPLDPQPGGAVTVELGWDGSTELVFTGVVDAVGHGIGKMQVCCVGSQMKLMKSRVDKPFTNQAAGQVVQILAGDVGVATDRVEDGIDLPGYLADSASNAYEHCLLLARNCGFDLYTTEQGKLVFAGFSVASADHTLRYGEHIVAASVERATPLDAVNVVPEGTASSAGDETACWLVKDPAPHQGAAGGGAAALLLSAPLLRTKDAAQSAADARLARSQRDAISGFVELMGSPGIKLGQTVALEGVPDSGADGLYQVMAVRHRLDRRRGLRTFVALGGMP